MKSGICPSKALGKENTQVSLLYLGTTVQDTGVATA